jgi:CBS domain containing-hemolysin-like protein
VPPEKAEALVRVAREGLVNVGRHSRATDVAVALRYEQEQVELVITDNGTAVGLVNVLDILLDRNSGQELRHYTRRIVSASESESAYRIIRRLRAARLSLAAVLDEQQKLTGVVTVEDLIRRLVQSA